MRPADLFDWFALRKHLRRPWAFVRSRHRPSDQPFVDLPLRDGGALRMRPEDRHIIKNVFARDEYRLDGLAPRSLGTVVDVGAHIGTFALRTSPLAERVLAFEPAEDNYGLLVRNTERLSNVKTFPRAVAGKSGRIALYLGKNASAHSTHPESRKTSTREVEGVSLADLFAEQGVERCGYLKLDCEGAEYETLYALSPELLGRIERIALEYHVVEGGAPDWTGERLAAWLGERGHAVELIPSEVRPGKGLIFSRLT